MAIDRKALELELQFTAGEYFKDHLHMIGAAVDYAIREYSALLAYEAASVLTTANGELTYPLPSDFRTMIDVYKDTGLYTTIYNNETNLIYNLTGLNTLTTNVNSNEFTDSYYLDITMDKIEFFRTQTALPTVTNWKVDETKRTVTFNALAVPSPYEVQTNYILYYYKSYTANTIPDYHQDHVYKLASSRLMYQQAMAMSKISATNGPGLNSTWVSPQIMMQMAKDLKDQTVNALGTFVPERG